MSATSRACAVTYGSAFSALSAHPRPRGRTGSWKADLPRITGQKSPARRRQVGTSVCKTLLPGPGMRVWTRWFSRNTVYNVTVYLLMRIARSTPASADEPIYLLPRSTGPNRKPRSRRPIGVQPGNMQGDPLPCMRAGRTERLPTNTGFSRRELCPTSKRRNGISAMPRQELQSLGPFVDLIHPRCPGSTATQGLASLSITARLIPHRGTSWLLATATSTSYNAKVTSLSRQVYGRIERLVFEITDTKYAELPMPLCPPATRLPCWWLVA